MASALEHKAGSHDPACSARTSAGRARLSPLTGRRETAPAAGAPSLAASRAPTSRRSSCRENCGATARRAGGPPAVRTMRFACNLVVGGLRQLGERLEAALPRDRGTKRGDVASAAIRSGQRTAASVTAGTRPCCGRPARPGSPCASTSQMPRRVAVERELSAGGVGSSPPPGRFDRLDRVPCLLERSRSAVQQPRAAERPVDQHESRQGLPTLSGPRSPSHAWSSARNASPAYSR
jgi:hypothetical protein